MPRIDTDYTNTIFYKIYCINPEITDKYIGHTTDFVRRKYSHKQSSINNNNECKLYRFIRDNGGWSNWKMEIIAFHKCEDQYDARKREQQYFEEYNATLNSIEPLSNRKINTTHTNSTSTPTTKYSCVICNYRSNNKRDYNKHLSTVKHNLRTKPFICECGKTYTFLSGLSRHKKTCTYTTEEEPENCIDFKSMIIDYKDMCITMMKENEKMMKENEKLQTLKDELQQTLIEIE